MERRIARALCALISIIAVFTTRAADAPQPLVLLESAVVVLLLTLAKIRRRPLLG